jgi:hypothetical protein
MVGETLPMPRLPGSTGGLAVHFSSCAGRVRMHRSAGKRWREGDRGRFGGRGVTARWCDIRLDWRPRRRPVEFAAFWPFGSARKRDPSRRWVW